MTASDIESHFATLLPRRLARSATPRLTGRSLFVGAGISISAGLPTATAFAEYLGESIREIDSQYSGTLNSFARAAADFEAISSREQLVVRVREMLSPPQGDSGCDLGYWSRPHQLVEIFTFQREIAVQMPLETQNGIRVAISRTRGASTCNPPGSPSNRRAGHRRRSVATSPAPVVAEIQALLWQPATGDNLSETTASLKERIEVLRGSRRSHSRHRADEEVGERLGYILDSIKVLVLPVSPATAFELLVSLIERDGDAMEQCGDDHYSVQTELETAANLVATAMKSLPSREARETLERLVAEDGYGTRRPLADVLANLSHRA